MGWFRRILSRGGRTRAAEGLKSDRLGVGEREAIEEELVLKASLDDNLEILKTMAGPSPDVVTRRLRVGERKIDAAVLSIEGLVDTSLLEAIVRALEYEVLQTGLRSVSKGDVLRELADRLLGLSRVLEVTTFSEVWDAMVRGRSVIIFDGTARALVCSTQGPETRTVDEPENEPAIRGPREGFIEDIRTNTSILRRRIGTPNLWIEELVLGRLTKTRVDVAYIKGLASEELVREVRQRVGRIEIDGILESGYVEEFIDDSPFALFPLVFRTERPDRVASGLLEGKVAILTDNTPYVLVVPMDFANILQAPDDYYEKWPAGSFLRIVRGTAFAASIFLPGTYVAVVTFHPELIPTQLLLKIASAREGVPFPVTFEVLLLELTFEFLREAGLRLPRVIGPAISIVGAIVLGESAVRAGLVSPVVVIVVAFTAIASFTVPTFSYGIAARLLRFVLIGLGGTFGLLGVQFGFFVLVIWLASLRSFGQPYLKPVAPMILGDLKDFIVRVPWPLMRTRAKLSGTREPVRMPASESARRRLEEENREKGGG